MGKQVFHILRKRPLSSFAAMLAVFIIIFEVSEIARGDLYQPVLDFMDGTTLIELGVLALLGLFTLRDQTDLLAVSSILLTGLSFIFLYEAIYKWSFYLTPFRLPMPPTEVREFIIQVGIAATILTGFANGFLTLKRSTFLWFSLFVFLWIGWLLIGYPQIKGGLMFSPLIQISLTHGMTYLLNRGTKAVMFFAYLTFFPSLRKR